MYMKTPSYAGDKGCHPHLFSRHCEELRDEAILGVDFNRVSFKLLFFEYPHRVSRHFFGFFLSIEYLVSRF